MNNNMFNSLEDLGTNYFSYFLPFDNIFSKEENILFDKNFFLEPNNNLFPNTEIIDTSKIISENIPNIPEENNTHLGRKRKNSLEVGKHGKYAGDNMTRKMKVILKDNLLNFINSTIKETLNLSTIILNGNKYDKENIKLLNINQKIIIDTTVNGNKKFLALKIKDIFSQDISGSFSSFPSNFNALLIDKIYEMENVDNITSILDKTVLEGLKYFRKDEDVINNYNYNCLKGLEKGFEGLKKEIMKKYDENYANNLIKLIKEFEIIYDNKKARTKRAK